MSRAKDDREVIQISQWLRADLVREMRAKAKRQRRRQKALIEEALADLMAKPEQPPSPG